MYRNTVEFEVFGDLALFTDPVTKLGGNKLSYQVPTYEALKGILKNIYWKPTITWIIDEVRIMNPILFESKGIRPLKYKYQGGNSLAAYTYLVNVRYQVRAHFIFNLNREEYKEDRNENKHHEKAKLEITRGGRRNIFLGCSECMGYVVPCKFGEGDGFYDNSGKLDFGVMIHGITYPDEAYPDKVPETKGRMCRRLMRAIMEDGIIKYPLPWECNHEVIKKGTIKKFKRVEE